MLLDSPDIIRLRLVDAGAEIGIIGRHQVVSDLPPHDFLRGMDAGGGRSFDHGTRCMLAAKFDNLGVVLCHSHAIVLASIYFNDTCIISLRSHLRARISLE